MIFEIFLDTRIESERGNAAIDKISDEISDEISHEVNYEVNYEVIYEANNSLACLRVVGVISMPPSIRAISSTRCLLSRSSM